MRLRGSADSSGRACPATKPPAASAITVGAGMNQIQSIIDWIP